MALYYSTILVVLTQLLGGGSNQLPSSSRGAEPSSQNHQVTRPVEVDPSVFDVGPLPSDPEGLRAREAKSARYNEGARDLTDPGDVFATQVWPRVEFIPAADSSVIVTGRVVDVKGYFSQDRSRIYSEVTIAVDEFIKLDETSTLIAPNIVVIDCPGGAIRLGDGRVVRDPFHICFLGWPVTGKRYVFFAKGLHKGADLELITSYELRDGMVFTNNGLDRSVEVSVSPGVPSDLANEDAFLTEVRYKARDRARNQEHRKDDTVNMVEENHLEKRSSSEPIREGSHR